MDLSLDVGDYKLNIRAAGAIIHNNKVLIHKNVNEDHCCIPGGRIEIGENSKETIKREIKEEMGKEVEVKRYLATIENFFELHGKKYHELFFLYQIEFTNEEDKKIDYTIKNIEGKDYLQYEWVDLDKLDEYNLLPICLKEILKMKDFPVHMINDDFKENVELTK